MKRRLAEHQAAALVVSLLFGVSASGQVGGGTSASGSSRHTAQDEPGETAKKAKAKKTKKKSTAQEQKKEKAASQGDEVKQSPGGAAADISDTPKQEPS